MFIILIAILIGCVKPDPEIIKLRTDPSLTVMPSIIQWNDFGKNNDGIKLWYKEATKTFNKPIIFACHGGYRTIDGKDIWYLYPDPPRKPQPVEDLAYSLCNLYPDHQIILIVCNEKAIPINIARVWYSQRRVWVTPTNYVNWFLIYCRMNSKAAIGSIEEMTSPPIVTYP